MATIEKQKQSLYFPEDMLREIMKESSRLDRSLSWTVQQAWRIARAEVRRFPAAGVLGPARAGEDDGAQAERPPSAQVLEFLKGKFDSEMTG